MIVRVIAPVNYVLQKSARAKPFVVHADKVKKCNGPTPPGWLYEPTDGAVPEARDGVTGHSPSAETPPLRARPHVDTRDASVTERPVLVTSEDDERQPGGETPQVSTRRPSRAHAEHLAATPASDITTNDVDRDRTDDGRPRRRHRKLPVRCAEFVHA